MENGGRRDVKDAVNHIGLDSVSGAGGMLRMPLTTLALILYLVYTPNFSPAYDLCTFCSLLLERTSLVIFEELAPSHHLGIPFNGISFMGGGIP